MIFSIIDGKVELLGGQVERHSLAMNGEQAKQKWLKLCEQAAVEQDPEKLVTLTREICRLLEERENELKKGRRL